jgi:DNA-binding IclR family transcriptional regulator
LFVNEPTESAVRFTTSGLGRALSVIEFLADHSPEAIGVSTVARELDLPKAVAHRILKELASNGFISFDESIKRYRLGAGALTVGLAALRGIDVPAVANRHMRRLVDATGETATLSIRQGWARVYIDQILSPHEIRMSVSLGSRHPLFAGSSSKAILAALPDEEVEEYLAGHTLDPLTASTITSIKRLRTDLANVRQTGYALSLGERQSGAASVAAPIMLASGEVFGSLSLCGPADRFPEARLTEYGEMIARAARDISAELGYSADHPRNSSLAVVPSQK